MNTDNYINFEKQNLMEMENQNMENIKKFKKVSEIFNQTIISLQNQLTNLNINNIQQRYIEHFELFKHNFNNLKQLN